MFLDRRGTSVKDLWMFANLWHPLRVTRSASLFPTLRQDMSAGCLAAWQPDTSAHFFLSLTQWLTKG